MLTNNYLNWRKVMFMGGSMSSLIGPSGSPLAHTPTMQHSYSADIGFSTNPRIASAPTEPGSYASKLDITRAYPGAYFGSGITPATKGDYTLENFITSGLSASSGGTALWKENDGLYVYEQRYLLTNTSDANITISEIGLFRTVVYEESTSRYWHYPVLMDRTVLAEPIYIAPGETKLVTYRINFNQTLCIDDSGETEDSGETVE